MSKKSTLKDSNDSKMKAQLVSNLRSKYGNSKYHQNFESKQILKLLKLLTIVIALGLSTRKSIRCSDTILYDAP